MAEVEGEIGILKPEQDKPFACNECSRSFATAQGLSMHKTRSHGSGKKWARNGPLTQPVADPEFQRPLDEGKIAEAETHWNQVVSFATATNEYLIVLREQIRFRKSLGLNDVELVEVFFLLYDDSEASA
jgi:hypothetical protein